MSLKSDLTKYIQERGQVSYKELEELCRQKGKKVSNMERRLRQSESPNIEPILENGAIRAYKWTGSPIKYQIYKVNGVEVAKVPIY